MNGMPLISVIVPVYNREKHIERCVDSIANQTYRNLEIILVDDGSKDNSLLLCQKYAERDSRVKVISQENAGPSKARNTGLDAATGDYIGFVDSDDTIELNMYEIMLKNIQDTGAQMAIVGMNYCYGESKREELFAGLGKCQLTKNEVLNLFFENSLLCFHCANKLYPKEVIGDVRFDTSIKMSEDQKFIYQLLKGVSMVVYEPIATYNIYHTEGSLSRATVSRYHLSQIDVNEYILDDLQELEIKEKAILRNVDVCLSVFVPHYKNGQFEKADIERIDNIIIKNKKLVMQKGNLAMRIKLMLYLISPDLLKFVLLKKNGA